MAASKKPMRLSRVAREFNLGIHTITEFLNKKGIEVEAKPNAKIVPEAYELLVQEFESDKTAKEESKKIGLSHSEKASVSIEEKDAEKEKEYDSETRDKDAEELIIRGTQKDTAAKKQEKKEETKSTSEKDSGSKAGEKQTETGELQKETPVSKTPEEVAKEKPESSEEAHKEKKEEERATEKEEPVNKEMSADTGAVKDKAASATDRGSTEKEEGSLSETQRQDSESPEEKAEATQAESKDDIQKSEGSVQEQEGKEEKDKGKLNIQGKIDLDKIETSTRPVKKGRKKDEKPQTSVHSEDKPGPQKEEKTEETPEDKSKAKKADKPEKKKAEETQQEAEEQASTEYSGREGFVKTEFEKLHGPTIVGKIDLPDKKKKEPKKKRPVATSAEEKQEKSKRKRRKRIKKAVDPNAPQEQKSEKKPYQKGDPARPAQPQSKRQKRKSKRKKAKQEPTEEEIQKQVKETLEKLSGTGKSKAAKYRREKRKEATESRKKEEEMKEQEKKVLEVTEFVTANELANMMGVDVNEIISVCMNMGMFVSINQRLDAETIAILADEFNYDVDFVSVEEQEETEVEEEDNPEDMKPRAPIVTVMGHVDHGKTSLLDHIREENVIAGEAGGITQHIGAYEVELPGDQSITFLDTPGHEAFTAMRARGVNITDIAIIVIAADDRVMPQTKEAINHAQAAGVPIIFAINKIDKPNAEPEKVKEELAGMNLLVEDWGGKYQSQEISAKHGKNVQELLEKVLLEAELLELKANPDKNAVGAVLESSLDRGRGYVSKLLVQGGTLKIGEVVLAGSHYGRVKAMFNERNQEIDSVGPSEPVLVLGLHGAPNAGDKFVVLNDEREAKNIATKRQQLQREQGIRSQKHVTLDEIGRRIAIGDFKELNIIVKGDMDGSVEALSDELLRLSNEEVQVNVIHKSVGQIIESDVLLASASDAIIIGFQVRPSPGARKLAEQEQIDIRTYSVIYEAKKQVTDAIVGLLSPEVKENVVANLEVRETFKISKVGTVAGCYVLDGKIHRNTNVRLIRDGIVIYTGKLGSLKRFKEDVKEVSKGFECGLNIENFNDVKVGDIIEGFETYEVKRSLEDMKDKK